MTRRSGPADPAALVGLRRRLAPLPQDGQARIHRLRLTAAGSLVEVGPTWGTQTAAVGGTYRSRGHVQQQRLPYRLVEVQPVAVIRAGVVLIIVQGNRRVAELGTRLR